MFFLFENDQNKKKNRGYKKTKLSRTNFDVGKSK